ncbi:hypothetical protein MKW98_011117 [Papaver atlanticum]|uniref:Low-temperature-induced 65 kDa protein n=1 Tax=Papaver atlanticum TaxID=357466 RepID=A0AAD4TK76_9MAGN|nr:hypothetical protein MKW98_011117 [Papaver atlanticum]
MDTHSSEEPHHQDELPEKKLSVIKRVKAKVKKIRDNIGSKIHGHDHEHDPELDLEDDDEEEEFLEALEQDAQVHAEPLHQSDEVKTGSKHLNSGTTASKVEHGGSGPTLESEEIGVPRSNWMDSSEKATSCPTRLHFAEKENTEQAGSKLGISSEVPKTCLEIPMPLEVDPYVPKDQFGTDSSGYNQAKVSDPTSAGPKEADVQPVVQSFVKMNFLEEPVQKATFTKQFSPDPTTVPTATNKETTPDNAELFHDRGFKETEPDNVNVDEETSKNPSYGEKITSATEGVHGSAASTISGTTISAKKIVASELEYSGDDKSNALAHDTKLMENECTSIGDHTKSSTTAEGDHGRKIAKTDEMNVDEELNGDTSYTEKTPLGISHIAVSEATTKMGTADSANDVVSSKLGYSGNDDSNIATNDIMLVDSEGMSISEQSESATVTSGDYGQEVAQPDDMNVDDEPNRNPSYTEKIKATTSAIAGSAASTITSTAISAKNVVASKLGYSRNYNNNVDTQDTKSMDKEATSIGEQNNSSTATMDKEGTSTGEHVNSSTAAVGDYGRPIAKIDDKPDKISSFTEQMPSAKSAIAVFEASTITDSEVSANAGGTSKLGYSGNDNSDIAASDAERTDKEATSIGEQNESWSETVGDYANQVAKPDDMNMVEDPIRNPSYTEKLKSATSAIAGSAASTITSTAISAKNIVASKLGYNGNDNGKVVTEDTNSTDKEGRDIAEQIKLSNATEGDYGQQIAATEKVALVSEKDAEAGTIALPNKTGTGTDTGTITNSTTDPATETGTGGVGFVTKQDKGTSVNYLVENLSPGDEGKPLCEVLSGIMDKTEEEFPKKVSENMDKVTESPEVAKRLGTDDYQWKDDEGNNGSSTGEGTESPPASKNMVDEGYGNNGSITDLGTESPTASKGMVDRVKGAVSYFWQKKDTGDQINADEQKISKEATTDEMIVSEGSTKEKKDESSTTAIVAI